MKRNMLFLCIAVLAFCWYPNPAYCQTQVMGVAGFGASFEDGGTFGAFVGGDIPLESDTTGFRTFTRVSYHFTDRDDDKENQGVDIWLMAKRNLWSWLTASIGGGMSYNFKDGDDEQGSGVKIEFGFAPINQAALILGIEHLPDAGTNGKNITFIYAGVNLLP